MGVLFKDHKNYQQTDYYSKVHNYCDITKLEKIYKTLHLEKLYDRIYIK
jgi:hypothetical protein